MSESNMTEEFIQQLAQHQNRLYGYVFSLLSEHNAAADVLQETNLVLWRKINEFQEGRPFLPWAMGIARFQVLAHLRDKKRDRLLLDAELASELTVIAEREASQLEEIRGALRPCLNTLTDNSKDLVEKRYFRGMSIADISSTVNRSISSVKVALLRSRRQLADCIQLRLESEGHS